MKLKNVFFIYFLCLASFNLTNGMSFDSHEFKRSHEELQEISFPDIIKQEIFNLDLNSIGSLLTNDEALELTKQQRDLLFGEALKRKNEIDELLESGVCISGRASNIERIINYLYAFKFIPHFQFPCVLFTKQPYHRAINPKEPVTHNTDLKSVLDALIKNEQEEILICCYHITDYEISKSLLSRKKDGVKVEILTNQDQGNRVESIKLLIENQISILCPNSHRYESNHHKFFIFKRNLLNKCLVWHGSFNATPYSAESSWEDVTIDDNPIIVKSYLKRFKEIKKSSTPMTIEMLTRK